jgi:formate hydrogenlyase subunit 3/multisubunit Na+/H+ antiporter MnhD subunit
MPPHLVLLTWAAVGVPAALALGFLVRPGRGLATRLAPWAAVPALVLAALHLVTPGALPGVASPVHAPSLFLGMRLGVDLLGGGVLALTAFLWMAAGAYARSYHRDDPRRGSFFAFFAATLAGNLGLVLAGDLLTFYFSFAVMTFAGWGLVVHERSAAALRAGRVYIILALIGEVAILAALFSLGAAAGGGILLGFDLMEAWVALGDRAPLVAGLAVAGFGVKAGLVPLHLWLPLAHPVAPTAASALLSGVMIKAGLLGWLRVLPWGGDVLLPGVGEALLVLGIVGAFYGVVVGLAQDDPKTILAYSSVSQMGSMALGTGLLVMLPSAAPLALGAVIVFALHHGVAKGALFLSVGLADRLTVPPGRGRGGDGSGSGGGGARRSGPWRWGLRLAVALPALALAGAPLTSGPMAKGALKEALAELGGSWYAVLDPLLLAAAFGTTLLLVRFAVVLEARATDREAGDGKASEGDAPGSRGGSGSGPWGLVFPLAVVVVAGLLAPAWLASLVPLPGEGMRATPGGGLPGPLDDVATALLPVLAALGVAGIVLAGTRAGAGRGPEGQDPEARGLPGLLARLARFRIPAGDLLVVVEALLRRRPDGPRAVARIANRTREAGEALEAAVIRLHARLESRDLGLARGWVVGVLLAGLVLVLSLALGPLLPSWRE